MADISKITLPNGSSYNIKDATARSGLDGKAASKHTHDDRYYTESEIDTKLNGKANTSHGNHVPATQTANNAVFLRNDNTWQTVTPANIGAATSSHTHDALYALKSKYGDTTINVGRKSDTTIGTYSTAEGYNTTASGPYSHAEGYKTTASGNYSHAEGSNTNSSGTSLPNRTVTISDVNYTITGSTAYGVNSHAEGTQSFAYGSSSHAEGTITTASGDSSHAEGALTTVSGTCSHAEGGATTASGPYSHAEGYKTTASGNYSHAEGQGTKASGDSSHAGGYNTTASGLGSHAEGSNTNSSGALLSDRTVTISDVDYTITGSTAYGINSHAEGTQSFAYGYSSHAEGYQTTASSQYSHAEGHQTTASGNCSHAEGQGTKASFVFSHAEGSHTTASGASSHAEGSGTTASSDSSHAGGQYSYASGKYSFSHGDHTKSINNQEASFGKYNKSSSDTLFSVGDGTADNARHNAFEITTTGGKLHDKDIATTDLIPTKLPANGGNADTLNGMSAEAIRSMSKNIESGTSASSLLADGTYCGGWSDAPSGLVDTQGTLIVSNYNTNGAPSSWSHRTFYSPHYNMIWHGFTANNIWYGWKEISTTPIKFTTFSETANETGSFTLWKSSENKVPILIQLNNQGFYAVPFLYQNQWWLGSTIHEVTRQPVPNVTVSGKIYYIEI